MDSHNKQGGRMGKKVKKKKRERKGKHTWDSDWEITLACVVHWGGTSSHTWKKLKGSPEADITLRFSKIYEKIWKLQFLHIFEVFTFPSKTQSYTMVWKHQEVFASQEMIDKTFSLWNTRPCLSRHQMVMSKICFIPIMVLRERSWTLFWFGPSGAPQNDTGE